MIHLERVYDPPARPAPGKRFLVERLWPRGIKKEAIVMDAWLRDVAPSTPLRQWYGHDPEKWEEFRRRYVHELDHNASALEPLLASARHGPITLLFGARDTERNSAVVLKEWLERHLGRSAHGGHAHSPAQH